MLTREDVPAMPFPRVKQGIPDARLDSKTTGSPEAALNQKVKNLIQKLGEAIHESVAESEDIAVVVKNIREQGFDVLLMLEATIGLNEVEPDAAESTEGNEQAHAPFTAHDLSFLRSLRISLTEEGHTPEAISGGTSSGTPDASEKDSE